jgi:hypothetical protein
VPALRRSRLGDQRSDLIDSSSSRRVVGRSAVGLEIFDVGLALRLPAAIDEGIAQDAEATRGFVPDSKCDARAWRRE